MISSQADAPTITSSSDPLILKLWNGQAPIGDGMRGRHKITVYLAQGDTAARRMNETTEASSILDVGGDNYLPWRRLS
jgi:hypothetical protein